MTAYGRKRVGGLCDASASWPSGRKAARSAGACSPASWPPLWRPSASRSTGWRGRPPGSPGATFLVGPADARVVAKLAPREAGAEMAERLRVLRAVEPPDPLVPRPLTDEPFALSVGLG